MPFYKLLKKQDKFQWTPEAQQAFDKLKEFLTNPPVLVPPMPEEPLLLYIVATSHVVSTAIVVERQEEGHIQKVQHPVYSRGSERIQDKVSSSLKNTICCADHLLEASTLLPSASNFGGYKFPDWRYTSQP